MKTFEEIKFLIATYEECLQHVINATMDTASLSIKEFCSLHTEASIRLRLTKLKKQLNDHHSS